MLITDLNEAKSLFEIDPDDHREDKNINFFIGYATRIIEEYLNRPGLSKQSRTEYYGGTGTQQLLLRSRPVFTTPTIQCFVDEGGGNYGQTSGGFDPNTTMLEYGKDFFVKIDQDDGTSRSGILVRNRDLWYKPGVRQRGFLAPFIARQDFGSIKVVYTGGWTVDTLPPDFRLAANTLVAKMRHMYPLGLALNQDGYEDRSFSILEERRDFFMAIVKSILITHRNWTF